MLPMLALASAAFAADDPVVEAAKEGTRVAVRKTRQGTVRTVRETRKGTKETVKAVRSAATWMSATSLKPSSDDIAKARNSGLVWADHQNWVYYKDGPSYGHTTTGEFWTEERAKGAGYKVGPDTPAVPAEPVAAKPAPAK